MAINRVPPTIQIADQFDWPLAHIADFSNRYPGETVHLTTRYQPSAGERGSQLTIFIPTGMELLMYTPTPAERIKQSYIHSEEDGQNIHLNLTDTIKAGSMVMVDTEVRILPVPRDLSLDSLAEIRDARGILIDSEKTGVFVQARSEYLKYLPEIYAESDFLGRFLMLFESFWQPIQSQIREGQNYYDVDMAPDEFIPWLASWIGVTWDQNLSEPRRRKMLRHALGIYQCRGTRQALHEFLKIYTGGDVQIVENRTQNFVLGKKSYLGHTIALGKFNFPHTFTVNLKIPMREITAIPGADDTQKQKNYYRLIESLIDTQKPAHTAFKLNLEVTPNPSETADDYPSA